MKFLVKVIFARSAFLASRRLVQSGPEILKFDVDHQKRNMSLDSLMSLAKQVIHIPDKFTDQQHSLANKNKFVCDFQEIYLLNVNLRSSLNFRFLNT